MKLIYMQSTDDTEKLHDLIDGKPDFELFYVDANENNKKIAETHNLTVFPICFEVTYSEGTDTLVKYAEGMDAVVAFVSA